MGKMQIPDKIAEKIEFSDKSGCWIWTGYENGNGYGVIYPNGKRTYVHRHLYELMVGKIPDGLELDHLICRTKSCVNPAHVEPSTHQQNMRRHGATKTKCAHGHDFTPENTYFRPGGKRYCRVCQMASCKRYYSNRVAESGGCHEDRSNRSSSTSGG